MQALLVMQAILLALSSVQASYIARECTGDDDFKCYNNGICMQVQINSSASMKLCSCAPGFTGRQCTQLETPCSPNPCGQNGYCNVVTDIDSEEKFFCRCKPGFTGLLCQENINECLSSTCYNGGLCIDGINSYECECKWPFTGRYCLTKMSCRTDNVCKNNGICIENNTNDIRCKCSPGFYGIDCSHRINKCEIEQPCANNAKCIPLINDYKCECSYGFQGRNCNSLNMCISNPCQNNSTCTSLDETNNSQSSYHCQCKPGYTGINCDTELQCSTKQCLNEINKIESEPPINNNEKNGSFVLVVNISPKEFTDRKTEIIAEFERQFGVLMLIKKDKNKSEMIYSFVPNELKRDTVWTRVYFILIFACLYDSNKLCLQNKVHNLNDNFEILDEMKKNSNLLPNYVSNITYEAYSSSKDVIHTLGNINKGSAHMKENNLTTVLVIILAIALIFVISMAFTVLIRQNAKRVKAPVWFPPPANNSNENSSSTTAAKFDYGDYESIKCQPVKKSAINRAFDDFSNFFSSSSSSSSNSDLYDTKPSKMRKLGNETKPVMIYNNEAITPDCYPSPPESLPESFINNSSNPNNPINLKGGNYSITPLMVFIMGRSKKRNSQQQKSAINGFQDHNEVDLIETFVNSGADLDAQNLDGETALHLAVRFGLYNICERLVQRGAHLHTFDIYGRNVLHTACGSNQLNIVKLLLEYCSQQLSMSSNLALDDKYDLIDSKSNDELGDTPLTIASRLNYNQLISLLIEYNVSVNATDNEGRSALHWCAKVNNVQGAYLLIQAGANVNMQDNDEKTPLASALNELNTKECADLLIKCDAFVCPEDEVKYNKMKQIAETIGCSSQINKSTKISNDLIHKLKQDNLTTTNYLTSKKSNIDKVVNKSNKISQISTSTKRKYSDTIGTVEVSSIQSPTPTQQIKRTQPPNQPVYTPLTPSPPLPHSSSVNYYQQQQQHQSLYNYYPSFNYDETAATYHGHYTNHHQQQPQQQQANNNYSYNYSEGYAAYF